MENGNIFKLIVTAFIEWRWFSLEVVQYCLCRRTGADRHHEMIWLNSPKILSSLTFLSFSVFLYLQFSCSIISFRNGGSMAVGTLRVVVEIPKCFQTISYNISKFTLFVWLFLMVIMMIFVRFYVSQLLEKYFHLRWLLLKFY